MQRSGGISKENQLSDLQKNSTEKEERGKIFPTIDQESTTRIRLPSWRNHKELRGGAIEEILMMMSGTLGKEGKVTIKNENDDDDKIKFNRGECDCIRRK